METKSCRTGISVFKSAVVAAVLVAILALVLGASFEYLGKREQKLARHLAEEKVRGITSTYFAGLKLLSVIGENEQREWLRSRVSKQWGVVDARVIRGRQVSLVFGEGDPSEEAKDSLDERAMSGQPVSTVSTGKQGRVLTVITPIYASKNYYGLNCLLCHGADKRVPVKEGDVLGAVRISYSMNEIDEYLENDAAHASRFYLALFFGSVLVGGILLWGVRKWKRGPDSGGGA